jgi:hypothetical protein
MYTRIRESNIPVVGFAYSTGAFRAARLSPQGGGSSTSRISVAFTRTRVPVLCSPRVGTDQKMKTCKRCGTSFTKRDREMPGRWAVRTYCSRACSDASKAELSHATAMARFESFIHYEPNSGCWLWDGSNTRGYATFRLAGSSTGRAARISYERTYGPISINLQIRHKCDTPACVNPDHLIPGTAGDNAQDKIDRHRVLRGTKNPVSKLSDEQVLAIRSDARPYPVMAREHGVSTATICNVRKRKVWRHVEG